jgi:Tfp pilus assembly protein PilF
LKPPEARDIFFAGMKNRIPKAEALLRKGLKAVEKDLPAQTVHYLGKGLKLDPGHYSLWAFYAVALGELALYEDSGEAFRKALRQAKGEKKAGIWSALADMQETQGRLKAAERSHRRAVRARPRNAGPWIRLGAFLAKRGRLDEAQVCHRKATTLREGAIDEAYLNLGYILRAKGKYGQARKCFLRAIDLDPGYSHAKAALKDVAPLVKQSRGTQGRA